jgi:hypothetical protein
MVRNSTTARPDPGLFADLCLARLEALVGDLAEVLTDRSRPPRSQSVSAETSSPIRPIAMSIWEQPSTSHASGSSPARWLSDERIDLLVEERPHGAR